MKPTIEWLTKRFTNERAYQRYVQTPHRQNGWIFGTDGHMFVAIEGDNELLPVADGAGIASMLSRAPAGEDIPLADLRTWAGDPEWHRPSTCTECDNGVCECSCGHTHTCKSCDGEGRTSPLYEPRTGLLYGFAVDGKRLACVTEAASDDHVRVEAVADLASTGHGFMIYGDGWRAAVMGLRLLEDAAPVERRFPPVPAPA